MLAAPALAGRRFLVLGLARTGLATLRFLARSGAEALAWDARAEARAAAAAEFPGLAFCDPETAPLDGLDGLLLSPGVPLNRHPAARRARAAGVPVLGDMELFQRARPGLPAHRVVGITGTNGKSTVTALVHHLLASAGRTARMGGNIGEPVLDQPALLEGGVYVLEISSFQIDLCQTLACDVAVWTNLAADHLDRYESIAAYAAAKERLFAMQPAGAHAVIATDDPWTRAAFARLPASTVRHRVSGADIRPEDQARWPGLPGPHNAQNAACAIAVARILGLAEAEIEAGLASFRPLAHRMETVATVAGVRYVNDSKATNPASAAPALASFSGIHWIAGGEAKTAELDCCLPHLLRVRAAYLVGSAAGLFESILAPRGVPTVMAGTVARAVALAAAAARPGETVLLSPACASFDQFADYAARGEAFRQAVLGLAPARGAPAGASAESC